MSRSCPPSYNSGGLVAPHMFCLYECILFLPSRPLLSPPPLSSQFCASPSTGCCASLVQRPPPLFSHSPCPVSLHSPPRCLCRPPNSLSSPLPGLVLSLGIYPPPLLPHTPAYLLWGVCCNAHKPLAALLALLKHCFWGTTCLHGSQCEADRT